MKNLEVIIMLPLAILSLLLLMVIDLVRMVKGKQTVDGEWHDVYVDSNLNHGQGRKKMMKKEFRDWLEEKKRDSTYSYLNNGKLIIPNPDIEKELELVIKKYDELHKPAVIPKYVAEWITNHREKFDLYPALRMLEHNTLVWGLIHKWYRTNTQKFVNAYLTGEYEVEEEPLYYALIKGHELIAGEDACKYWKCDMRNGSMFLSNRYSHYGRYLAEMTENDWGKFGINESNADFVKAGE